MVRPVRVAIVPLPQDPAARPADLQWIDAHKGRAGEWPRRDSAPSPEARGTPGPRSTWRWSRAFAEYPGRHPGPIPGTAPRTCPTTQNDPPSPVEQILLWADAHRGRTTAGHAKLPAPSPAKRITWGSINDDLGARLAGLPAAVRWPSCWPSPGRRGTWPACPRLTVGKILEWADRHQARPGPGRPDLRPGDGSGGETWLAVDRRLRRAAAAARRLVPTPASGEARGVRNTSKLPGLTEDQILSWARAHKRPRGPAKCTVFRVRVGRNSPRFFG